MSVWLVSLGLPQDSTLSQRCRVQSLFSEGCPREPRGCVRGAGVEFKVCAKTPIISNYQIYFVYDETKS